MDAINKLLDGYDVRKREQREAFEREQREAKDAAEKGMRLLSAVAMPVLNKIADAISAKGHQCDVVERFGVRGSIVLEFRPNESSPALLPSMLSFTLNGSGDLTVSQMIETGTRSRIEKTWSLADVSESKVQSRALSFIEAVLRES